GNLSPSLPDEVEHDALLEHARAAGEEAGSPVGAWAAAQAALLLGRNSLRAGDVDRALERFDAAFALAHTAGIEGRVAMPLVVQTLMLSAEAHASRDAREPAAATLRRALELTAEAADPDLRDRMVPIVHRLHVCMLRQGEGA